jgi:hypothetical protein
MPITNDTLTAALGSGNDRFYIKAAQTAEAANEFHTYWYGAGFPSSSTGPVAAGARITSTFSGAFPYTTAAVGNQKFLGAWSINGGTAMQVMLADRLWQSSFILTSSEAVTTVPSTYWARDEDNTTAGRNVVVALEAYVATTNAVATRTCTITYVNSAGTTGRTGTLCKALPATAVHGWTGFFCLADGDLGVQRIESFFWSSAPSTGGGGAASMTFVAYRMLASNTIAVANIGGDKNFYDLGQRLYDGSALSFMTLAPGTALTQLGGNLKMIEMTT